MRPLLAIALLALVAHAPAAESNSGAKPEAPGIAVLRLDETFHVFKMFTTGMDRVKEEFAKGKATIGELENQLQEDEHKLQVLQPGSDKFTQVELEYEQLKTSRDFTIDRGNRALNLHRALLYKACFGYIRTSLAAFCQDKGIKLVHIAPNPELEGTDEHGTAQQLLADYRQELMSQSVLFYTPDLDITDAFVVYLNDRWTNDAAEQQKESTEQAGHTSLVPALPSANPAAPTPAPAPSAPSAPSPSIAPAVAPAPAPAPAK
jgi:Skp family chaperone for outer membrane proteins